MKRKAFTLIELLVVIAIVALLLAVILPSLTAAKELATGAVCLSNQRQLCLAWISYAEDNNGFLVGGSTYGTGSWRPTPYRWVELPALDDSYNPDPPRNDPVLPVAQYCLEYRLNGIRAGELFPYTQDVDIYHCPGDKTHVKEPEPYAAFRSYTISALMNSELFVSRVSGIFSRINVYEDLITAPGGAPQVVKVAEKMSEIKAPGNKFVFVEEDIVQGAFKQPVNLGGFIMLKYSPPAYDWLDVPAEYHNSSSTIGFADGHAERHRWRDSDTLKLIRGEISRDPDPLNNEDLHWMVRGFIPRP